MKTLLCVTRDWPQFIHQLYPQIYFLTLFQQYTTFAHGDKYINKILQIRHYFKKYIFPFSVGSSLIVALYSEMGVVAEDFAISVLATVFSKSTVMGFSGVSVLDSVDSGGGASAAGGAPEGTHHTAPLPLPARLVALSGRGGVLAG